MMNMKTNKRYWIHISSNENRNSILRNGLIPQSILNSKQFSKESRIIFNEYIPIIKNIDPTIKKTNPKVLV
jgi:hypothetical protein